MKFVNKRNIIFIFLSIVAILMIYGPLKELLSNTDHSEYYSHILLIPLVSGYFIYIKRKALFSNLEYSYIPGIILLVIGILFYIVGREQRAQFNLNDYSSLIIFSGIIFWIGGIVLLYGIKTFQKISFPLLFLIFMIPIPTLLMDRIIYLLQAASAETTHLLFIITGISFSREGFTFHLPGMTIEVAKQCSGIRSSLGLFITGVLAGHLFLKTGWQKVILALLVFPITVFKNGIRITTLSALAIYVDEKFITQSSLHHSGGFVFYIPALLLLGAVIWYFRKLEQKSSSTAKTMDNKTS
jgi:exosortase